MSSILDDVANIVNDAMGDLVFYDSVLIRDVVATGGDPADPPAPTPTPFPCKALRDVYSAFDKLNTSIATSDVKIMILAKSISTKPTGNDIIQYEGASFSIIKVDIDPANAVWVCQARQ